MSVKPPTAAILLLCGAPGAGKRTLLARLLASRPELRQIAISTTRTTTWQSGLDEADFSGKAARSEIAELAIINGHRYGLPLSLLRESHKRKELPAAIVAPPWVAVLKDKMPVISILITASPETIASRGDMAGRRRMDAVEPDTSGIDKIITNEDGSFEAAAEELVRFYDRTARPRLQRFTESVNRPVRRGAKI